MPRKRPKPRQSRCDSATVQLRIQEVLQLILDGAAEWDIREYVAEKCKTGEAPWKVKRSLAYRTVGHYITAARKRIVESSIAADPDALKKHLAQRQSLYARSVNAGDMRTALAVLDSLDTLLDHFPEKKVGVRNTGKVEIELVDDNSFYGNEDRLATPPPDAPSSPGTD